MITINDVEWMLSEEFDTLRRNDFVIIESDDQLGFASTRDFLGTPVVVISFIPGQGLAPSAGLFRWVAVNAGNFLIGSLSALVNDDGLVDVHLRHSLFDSSLEQEDLNLVVKVLAASASDLRRDLNSLFG